MTDQPRRWIVDVEPVIVIRPDMTPEEWDAVIVALGIPQERINQAIAALIAAADDQKEVA